MRMALDRWSFAAAAAAARKAIAVYFKNSGFLLQWEPILKRAYRRYRQCADFSRQYALDVGVCVRSVGIVA
jgi:hypothetical protein